MLELIFFAIGCVTMGGVGVAVGRNTAPDTKTVTVEADPNKFKCPYCKVDVTGYKELDRINHTSCIGLAESDLEKIRTEAEEAAANAGGKYKVTIDQHRQKTKPNYPNIWDQDYDTDIWVRYEWKVFDPTGALIDYGYEPYKDDAEERAEAVVELDKEKHTTYEVA